MHASAGHGHEMAAKAVEERCRTEMLGADIRLVDALTFTRPIFGPSYKGSYLWLIQHAPMVWGFFYALLDIAPIYALVKPLRRLVNGFMARPLEKMLLEFKPDVIVATHFLSLEVVSHLKRTGKLDTFFITVITDFRPHTFWLEREVEAYAVAAPETREELIRRGVPGSKIHVTGIPVTQKFSKREDRQKLFDEWAFDKNILTVLVTSGGAGIGSLQCVTKGLYALTPPLQILVACGTNRALFEEMRSWAADKKRVKIFGFVNFMEKLMDAADAVIGKGGGLTISESLCKGRPMVLFQPVPGQETRNADLLHRHGAALIAHSPEEVVDRMREMTQDRARFEVFRAAATALGRPDSAQEIVRLAQSG